MSEHHPYQQVIVGTDGSATATAAVRAASVVAHALSVPLAVATSWERDRDDAPATSEAASYPGGSVASHEAAWASETVAGAAGVARQVGVEDVETHTPIGAPGDTLVRLGEDTPGSLLVVGTAGLGSRTERLVGNVPHHLTHHATRDLLLIDTVRAQTDPSWRRIALATDGSDTAAVACRRGLALARALDAEVTLLTVAKDQAQGERVLDDALAAIGDGGDIGRQVVVGRDVAATLSQAAADHDLLVIGNKGMSGPSRLLGSVSNKVTHEVATDMLLVNSTR